MKKIYYFSKSKLQFVEINNFYKKFVFLVSILSVIIGFILFGSYYVINGFLNPENDVAYLRAKNHELESKLKSLLEQYSDLNDKIDRIAKTDNDLRLAVNLEPIPDEEREVGIGGGKDFNIIPTGNNEVSEVISGLTHYADVISAKVNFELNNYKSISEQLETNKKLYSAIPAIRPMEGRIGDRFGIRMHPILKVRKMHNGLDIIANTGTKVYAPGNGKVVRVGYQSGYGKVLEIDHGFGYTTRYAHLSKILVRKGQRVERGDVIALSGNSGRLTTGPHLHYEVRHNGVALNPKNFMFDDIKIFDIVANKNIAGED